MLVKLEDAISALKDGAKETSQKLLDEILQNDPYNEAAWVCMSNVVESIEQRLHCLKKVLAINPSNEIAKLDIAKLQSQIANQTLRVESTALFEKNSASIPTQTSDLYPKKIERFESEPNIQSGNSQQVTLIPSQTRLKKILGRWEQPFRTAQEVRSRFPDYIDEVLSLTEDIRSKINKEIESLKFAKEQWHRAGSDVRNMNSFLSPAVRATAIIAQLLIQAGKYTEAFWIGNIFGEMCKMLLGGNREKYIECFETLLLTACCSVGSSWLNISRQLKNDKAKEIEDLRSQLEGLCRYALSTYFDKKYGEFKRFHQPDYSLRERVINEALAQYFDTRLRYLIQQDRPRVKEYVSTNMPVIYKLKLFKDWDGKVSEWERLLVSTGYDDLIHSLKSTGELVRADKVGQLSSEQLEDIRRATANNDMNRVRDLLKSNADEIKFYLYTEAQARLDYREPQHPNLTGYHSNRFTKVIHLSKTNDPDKLLQALDIVQNLWQSEINNLELRDWVAYLQAKTNNPKAAEPILTHIQKRRDARYNFATDWNLAVLAYDRKDENATYQLLIPLLDRGIADDDLVLVVLALSLKLDDRVRFLTTIPKTLSLRFHPLAIVIAHDVQDKKREDELLAQLLRQSQAKWELPSVVTRYTNIETLQQTVNRAIVEGQIDQVISWLEARINSVKGWIPNYLVLARIHEEERQDIDAAFRVLRQRLEQQQKFKPREQNRIDDACRGLLELCRRGKRKDLGLQAYKMANNANANNDLLSSFALFAPEQPGRIKEIEEPSTIGAAKKNDIVNIPPISIIRDPSLAERLAWVTAELTNIRNIASYVSKFKAVEELEKIISEINPQESETVVKLIQDTSEVIQAFFRTEINDYDARNVFYNRATGYEKRLSQLLGGGALFKSLVDVITPYYAALKQVMGDLSRQAGISPNIQAAIENPFISLENRRSTLVLRVTNISERPTIDVLVELIVKDSIISLAGTREQKIAVLDPHQSYLLGFPFEHNHIADSNGIKKIGFGISLRASAEGFPNIDLGFTEREIPVNTLRQAIGIELIPRVFQPAKPLFPSKQSDDPDLFQGRSDILGKIKNSFHGGIQRERYFLDGIRRVGKTTILNYLPQYLPDSVIPVHINLEKFGLQGTANSSSILHRFCELIRKSTLQYTQSNIDVPDLSAFEYDSSVAFSEFLVLFKTKLPGRVPFLMIDEFQKILDAIARTGAGRDRDALVLDLIRGYMDDGNIYALFTGSVRFDRLSNILNHHIFGSLTRLRVSFLSEESVSEVLRSGIGQWAIIPQETIRKVYELTGGYPWLVQTYGAGLVDLLNRECRTIAIPEDVDYVTNDAVLCNDELFSYWWPTDQLGIDEELFIEALFRTYSSDQIIHTRDFFASIPHREQQTYKRALDNLRACEVFDSMQSDVLKFSGRVLRQWLEQQVQPDGRFKILVHGNDKEEEAGEAGIFIDHENFIKSLERISRSRGIDSYSDKLNWFSQILNHILLECMKRVKGVLRFKVTVAFWDRPQESSLLSSYFFHGFTPAQPERIKLENAVDFKLADEVRRANEQAIRERTKLSQALIITGDGDLSHVARALVNDQINVQIWGGSQETNKMYVDIVGSRNVVVLDDVCGL